MADWFVSLGPATQALVGGLATWGVTALGAGLVFLTRSIPQRVLDAMLGFAAGVMIAASVWSLLRPAIELTESQGRPGWLPAAIGFGLGVVFLRIADHLLPTCTPAWA